MLLQQGVLLPHPPQIWLENLPSISPDVATLPSLPYWLNAYDSVFGALRQTFPRRLTFIDGFFRRDNQPKAAKKPAPGPVIVPAATGT